MKLDKNRPFAMLFDGERQIQCHYQDGKMYDRSTDEELNLDSIPKKTKEPPALICKFCRTKRQTAELMSEHLIARHSEEMAEAKAKKEAEEKTEAEDQDSTGISEAQVKANAEAKAEPETEAKGGGTEPEAEKAEAKAKAKTGAKKKG